MTGKPAEFDDHLPCHASPQYSHYFDRSDTEETEQQKMDEPAFSDQNQEDPGDE